MILNRAEFLSESNRFFENPWDKIDEIYPVGTQIERKIAKVTNAGAFIELEEGISGFLHVDDLSWTKKVKNTFFCFKTG